MSGRPQRRDVRPTRGFYEDVYRQFPLERSPGGDPSRMDFDLYELPRLFRDVADQWDHLFQPVPGRPDYRTFITVGVHDPGVARRRTLNAQVR